MLLLFGMAQQISVEACCSLLFFSFCFLTILDLWVRTRVVHLGHLVGFPVVVVSKPRVLVPTCLSFLSQIRFVV